MPSIVIELTEEWQDVTGQLSDGVAYSVTAHNSPVLIFESETNPVRRDVGAEAVPHRSVVPFTTAFPLKIWMRNFYGTGHVTVNGGI